MMGEEIHLDWNALQQIVPICVDFAKKNSEGQDVDLRDCVNRIGRALGVDDVDKFARRQLQVALSDGLGQAFDSKEAKAMASLFTSSCKPVMSLISDFAKGDIPVDEMVAGLNKLWLKDSEKIAPLLQKSLGISDDMAELLGEKLGQYTLSIYCFAGAFEIYEAAAHDAALAKAHRMEIEQLAAESIAQLKAQRAEMDALVNEYLYGRLLPFEESVAAMDKAILENDDDGYIAANAELWELFGREAQYRTASEFDDLMLSDDAFRL